ncbi:hypothetical protein BIY29_18475 [Brenneria alni]|uniref:Uncharacterized protein n=1 Tax=Brenneria alni TaxID=71656 RepID=A0A421DJ56_9GAMM|nr:hypothetical protein [Brenneria alni]RLM18324.1 hypothetical protein BIY29_18475 [Brenneria alni]
MNKTVYVPSYFQPIYKEVTVKVPTGNTKRFLGIIDIDEKIRQKKVIQDGWSDCQIDGERLNEDVGRAIDKLNKDGYEVISITPATSGSWAYKYQQNDINNGNGKGSYGYGYGYSYTEGVLILAKKLDEKDF